MKKILLDTHILIWLAYDARIGKKTHQLIMGADAVYVSAGSILELRIKQAAGKLPGIDDVIASLNSLGCTVLDVTKAHADSYRLFGDVNRDPFDNLLSSIAIQESLTFVTADKKILALKKPGLVTVDARK